MLNESSAESSCRIFSRYFHAATSNHLSEKPDDTSCFIWFLSTGLTVLIVCYDVNCVLSRRGLDIFRMS